MGLSSATLSALMAKLASDPSLVQPPEAASAQDSGEDCCNQGTM